MKAQIKTLLVGLYILSGASTMAATHIAPANLCQRNALLRATAKLEQNYPDYSISESTSILAIAQSEDAVTITVEDNQLPDVLVEVTVGIRDFKKGGYCEFTGSVKITNQDNF